MAHWTIHQPQTTGLAVTPQHLPHALLYLACLYQPIKTLVKALFRAPTLDFLFLSILPVVHTVSPFSYAQNLICSSHSTICLRI